MGSVDRPPPPAQCDPHRLWLRAYHGGGARWPLSASHRSEGCCLQSAPTRTPLTCCCQQCG
eukprot:4805567-Pleurochrysis_carterae.AAC.1